MEINENKLEEVGALTEVESKDINPKKIKRKIALIYYYLIQSVFLATSGLIGFIFGIYENEVNTYPYVGFDKNYIIGPVIVAIVQGGNFGMSYKLRRLDKLTLKKGTTTQLSPFYIYPVVLLNLILSLLLFLSIYQLFEPRFSQTMFPMYGVFNRKKVTSKNIFSRSNHV
ncbi:MAG: hypothetical protein ACTSVO_02840 [Candidatus Heimdallarchaeaceae archaeon]